MSVIILLLLITNITSEPNVLERGIDFNACNYTNNYRQVNFQLFEDKEHILKECEILKKNDQRFRGAERELMNDINNILRLSVIVESQIQNKNKLENKLVQTISSVLNHNPSYFTEYFHKPLIEFINSNRCESEEETILLRRIYLNLFGQPYIDNVTRFHTQSQRNLVMTERIKEEIDQKLKFKDLCSKIDSFLSKKIILSEGAIIGKWRRLSANEDLIITIREKDNGDLYMIQTNFDSAFPSIKKIIRTNQNSFKYETPYSSKTFQIAVNGSLKFKYKESDSKIFNYPIYVEN